MSFTSRRTQALVLAFFAITTIFTRLGEGNLPSYDDAYYAQKARQILSGGDWWTMRVADKERFDNPPGFMWLMAGSFRAFGVSEFSARLPSALGGVLGILGTFFLFSLLLGDRVGFLAALLLNLTTVYLKYARHSMMDATVTASIVWCFYFFLRGLREREGRWYLVAGVAGSYVMFAKSAFGALPVFALLAYLLATRQFRPFASPWFWLGCVLMCLPYGVWSLVEWRLYGERFLEAHFVKLILHASENRGPNDYWYDYFVVMLKYIPLFLPALLYGAWLAVRSRGEAARAEWFALIYLVVFMAFLTVQATKKTWYFLPAFPACAGLAAVGFDRWLGRVSLERIVRGTALLAAATFVVLNVTPVSLGIERAVDTKRIAPYARAAAAQGFVLLGYKIDYWGINSALLFYSDQAATPVDDAQLAEGLRANAKVALLLEPGQWPAVREAHPELRVIRQSRKMVLVSNVPLAQEEVF